MKPSPRRTELIAYLRRRELARLWERVRGTLETRGGVGGTVALEGLDDTERDAVAGLLGLATRPQPKGRVRLVRLDEALRESRFGVGLEAAMEAHGGPLRDRPAERSAEAARWRALWIEARRRLDGLPPAAKAMTAGALGDWLAALRSDGYLRRLAGGGGSEAARRLLDATADVLAALPSETGGSERVRRRVLAAERLGSSHALDDGQPVASLVLRALAVLAGEPPPTTASERRTLWERAGVVPDDLSCDVLVLGLRPLGDGLVARALRSFAAAGEPFRLTLRQVATSRLRLAGETVIHVCENPALVSVAADRLGAGCRPLVCLSGMASSAALDLLAALRADGAALLYHGDFDWGGLRIANALRRTVPFEPWRFSAADYEAAVASGGSLLPLDGSRIEASWDPRLARIMERVGAAVEEETLVESLVGDLGA